MNNENNVTQENNNVPTQKNNSGKNNSKQPRARRNIKAEAAHMLAFLKSCTLYQADAVMKFRVERSEVLMNSVTQFCTQPQILKATVALMRITTDAEAVK